MQLHLDILLLLRAVLERIKCSCELKLTRQGMKVSIPLDSECGRQQTSLKFMAVSAIAGRV